MKKIIPIYLASFVLFFMLFIYEPITMYANNMNDFWFDLPMIIKPCILAALISWLAISVIYTIIFFINKKINNKLRVFNILSILFFVGFLGLYIQGNYLSGSLPGIDGSAFSWKNYIQPTIISTIVWIAISLIYLITTIKFKAEKVLKISSYISLAVLFMLGTSFVTTLLTTDKLFDKKVIPISTMKNYYNLSKNNNFLIFLLDAEDSVMFEQVMNNDNDFKNTFEDFTYYPDTMSTYSYTRESIPYILTGVYNENETDYKTYYNNAMDQSPLFKELLDRNYDINLYEMDFSWESENAKKISNIELANRSISKKQFIKEQIKYDIFKYFPYLLKGFSKIENLNYHNAKIEGEYDHFDWGDIHNNALLQRPVELVDNNYFHFLHIEGAHVNFDLSKDVQYLRDENGNIRTSNYQEKVAASLTIINNYLKRLKDNNAYNNTAVIVMSDHGYALGNGPDGRQNPILFIKGINEHHKMIKSDIPVSYADLNDAYVDLLNGKSSKELFKNIDPQRKRRLIWYNWTEEDHMVEYLQNGKAWDESTLVPTGKEFNRGKYK